MTDVLIDTDPGMDDAIAIAVAHKSPALTIRAITAVTGNLPSDRTASNARKVLDLLSAPEIPVAQGPLVPSAGDYPVDPFSHGADGLAESHLPESTRELDSRTAAQLIVDTVNAYPGITILGLGPMTNVAAALEIDPDLPAKVGRLIIIGGSFGATPYAWSQATGANPVSEWNVFVDPEAAKRVFHAGFELLAVGLDVGTHPEINFRPGDLDQLRASDRPEAEFATRVVDFVNGRGYQSYCSLIDSTAVAAAIDPTLLETDVVLCDIALADGLTRGMTVVDRRNHHAWTDMPRIRIATGMDFGRFLDLVTAELVR
ncbi:nucleoside hydrolase [Dactylosporangium sp. NPDC048998]|uniref:nucleoside hydrolase n=1 Tax=Dactylosporangium sp. NPDC048998 TaxID=3363976 RepID=UPI00371373C7